MEIPKKIKDRYWRTTIAFPEGTVTHHVDCIVYRHKICGCGFLMDLSTCTNARELHPRFDEEYNAQSLALDKLSQQ
jgi:hypothetical protein